LNNGTLEGRRWESWSKLQKEMVNFEHRKERKQKLKEKQWMKQMSSNKDNRQNIKAKIKNMDLD